MTLLEGISLRQIKNTNFKFSENTNISCEIILSNFEHDVLNNFQSIAFLGRTDSCQSVIHFHVYLDNK